MKNSNLSPDSERNCVIPAQKKWRSHVIGRILRFLLLAVTVIVTWLSIEDRWGRNFQFPTRYAYDAHYILGMMKLAQEGDLGLWGHITTHSLGAPFEGQLNDFPQAERVIVWLGGQIARFTGLMSAANVMLILSCLVAAFSFYLAARLWRISRLVAWILAVVYAFLPHNIRSLDNLGIIFTGLLPLQLYVLWYVATVPKLSWRSNRFRLTLIIAMSSGMLNVYWIFLFFQLYLITLLCRILKRREDFLMASIPLVITCLVGIINLGSFAIYKMNYGENSMGLLRSYYDIERWSLKPIDLFLPGKGQVLGFLANYFSRYYKGGRLEIGEDWWGNYIGVCSILGLLLLLLKGTQRQFNKHSASLPYLAVLWIIAYASFGGIHAIISLILDFYNIRCTNRYSVAIGTISFLYFAFVVHRTTRQWRFISKCAPLALLAVFAVAEQSYRSYKFSQLSPIAYFRQVITEDRDLVVELEQKHDLEPGSMIYILPVLDFPEPFVGRGKHKTNFTHYEPIRPFLYSTKLRYSYGGNKGRQGADWQLDVQELPARAMARTLESYGFSGILLNRKGYEDRGEALLEELAQAGWPMEFEQGINNEWVFIRLSPALEPILPTLTPYAVTTQE